MSLCDYHVKRNITKCRVCGERQYVYWGWPVVCYEDITLQDRFIRERDHYGLGMGLVECACGNVGQDRLDNDDGSIIESSQYQEVINNDSLPVNSRQFMALSLIEEKKKEYTYAAWSSIKAAWGASDYDQSELAVSCWLRALNLIESIKQYGDASLNESESKSQLIEADICRSTGRFEQAEELLKGDVTDKMAIFFNYERKLIYDSNRETATVVQAVRWNQDQGFLSL